MSRRIPVIATCAATLAFSALPVSAMTRSSSAMTSPGVATRASRLPTRAAIHAPNEQIRVDDFYDVIGYTTAYLEAYGAL